MSNKSEPKTRVEKYPLPPTVDGICDLVREILSPGLVQRLEIEVSKPVRVVRVVEEEEAGLLEEDVDLDGRLRNIEMIEYTSEGAGPFQTVFDMMHIIQEARLHPVCWATGASEPFLSEWFELAARGMPTRIKTLNGLPIKQLKSLPEDTLILCGSGYPSAEPSELTLAVKVAVELRRPIDANTQTVSSREVDDPVRHNPRECDQATDPLAPSSRGLRTVDWKPEGHAGR